MRRLLLLAALAAISWASAASLPDTVTRDRVTYARRGSLGANAYVATNVVVSPPAYQLSRVAEMKLRDRCVNYASVAGTNAVFALPGRKTTAGCARAFILYLDALDAGGCAVSFTGAAALYTTDWTDAPRVGMGKRLFSFIEIADNEYLVETRELEEIGRGN